ncbi:hypothetical protein [Mesorhizobium sp. LSJC265A00]|uniref:hypothetical protein n=1 Tax=Mesorhizobium sp. LSJC265A00 TaxID=1287322 RepID=UPI0012EB2126|nr:hypothetical protein [Mesorhizobium sp. LSJC265A00]
MEESYDDFLSRYRMTRGKKFYFLTLAPRMFAVPLEEAPDFDHSILQSWAERLLSGHTYIGIVEAAFYGNFGLVPGSRTVSWHVHALLWDTNERSVQAINDAVDGAHDALLPGGHAGDMMELGVRGAASHIIYMLKGQLKEYRCGPTKKEKVDPKTGEIVNKWWQQKRPLRTGDLAKMMKVMAARTIPGLCFAGGAGRVIWQTAEAQATTRIAEENASVVEKLRPYRTALSAMSKAGIKRPSSSSPVV